MNTATNTRSTFAPVTIGTSPAGVEWVARKPEHVAIMTERLAKLWEKHDAQVVTARMTPAGADRVEMTAWATEYEPLITVGKTFVRGPRYVLADIALQLDEATTYLPAEEGEDGAETEQQGAFAARSIERSLECAVRDLWKAIGNVS